MFVRVNPVRSHGLYRAPRSEVDHYRRQQISGGRQIFAGRDDGEAYQIRAILRDGRGVDELAIFRGEREAVAGIDGRER